jgi:ribosomal protein S18 acetylase RimI-like enzyme
MPVRPMTAADIPAVKTGFIELYRYFAELDFSFNLNLDYLDEYLALQLKSRLSCLLVLEEGGEVLGWVGCAASGVNRKFIWDGPKYYGIISELWVEPAHRRAGRAQELIRAAEDYFRAQGFSAVRVEALSANSAALELYRQTGFTDDYVSFKKRL